MQGNYRWIKPYLKWVFLASVFSILLGLVTSLMTLWIGPTLQVLLNQESLSNSTVIKDLWPFIPTEVFKALRLDANQVISKVDLFSLLPSVLISIAFLRAISGIAQFYLWEDVGEKIARDLRNVLQSLYLNSRPESRYRKEFVEFEKNLSGLFHNDIRIYKENLIRVYGAIPRETLQIGLLLGLLFWIHFKLVLFILILCVPLGLLLRVVGKSLRKRSRGVLEKQSWMSETLQQRLLGFETIKHYRSEGLESLKFSQFVENYVSSILRSLKIKQSISPLMEVFAGVGISLLIYLSFMSEDISNGYTGAMQLTFFATLGLLMQSIDRVSRYFNSLNEAKVASGRIQSAISFLNPLQTESKAKSLNHSVDDSLMNIDQSPVILADRISFKYPESDSFVFKDLKIEIPAQTFCVLVGSSGKGKSTFVKLCLGILKPTGGHIKIKYQPEWIGYIPQQLPKFQLSVRDFMHYPLSGSSTDFDSRIIECLKELGLVDLFLDNSSLSEMLGSGGKELSGGQWQRLYFARVLFKEYRFLIIDEPSSALDPQNELEMIQLLRKLVKNRISVLAIAHRPAMIEAAQVLIQI